MVRNFPRPELFAEPPPKTRKHELIYLGGMSVPRGAKCLVDIMRELRKSHPLIRLICLGPFNEAHIEKETKEYAELCGVKDAIDFIPFVPHEKVASFLRKVCIGLVPWQPNPQMLKMCYPNKIFEYMAAGLPIVASNLPGLCVLLEAAECSILVTPDDPMAHVRAIRRLLDDPNEAEILGARGFYYAQKHFSWAHESRALLDLYATF